MDNEAKLDNFSATMAVEGCWELSGMEPSDENYILSCQHLIDTGLAWTLQGAFGRACQWMIDEGHCHER